MVNIHIRLGRIEFKVCLSTRVVIIDDDSGKGKTCLFNIIDKYPANHARVFSELPVRTCNSVSDVQDLTETSIVFIDEDCKCLSHGQVDDTISLLRNTDHYFVIITRENKLSRLAYSVDCIFKLCKENGVLGLQKRYDYLYKKNTGMPINEIYIEDETTGFLFFSKCVPNCVSFHGKDNYSICFNEPLKNRLIVIDRVGFGACMKDFVTILKEHAEIQVLDYESFEEMLLDAMGIYVKIDSFLKAEAVLTKILQSHLNQYGKSLSCSCLVKCKHCANCQYHDYLLNSKQVFLNTRYAKYVEWS